MVTESTYLVTEEDPFRGKVFLRLDPRVAREMHRAPLDTVSFYDNAFEKELSGVPVQHRNSTRLAEGWIQHELHRVHHTVSFFAVAFLRPVFDRNLAAPYRVSCFYSNQFSDQILDW